MIENRQKGNILTLEVSTVAWQKLLVPLLLILLFDLTQSYIYIEANAGM